MVSMLVLAIETMIRDDLIWQIYRRVGSINMIMYYYGDLRLYIERQIRDDFLRIEPKQYDTNYRFWKIDL